VFHWIDPLVMRLTTLDVQVGNAHVQLANGDEAEGRWALGELQSYSFRLGQEVGRQVSTYLRVDRPAGVRVGMASRVVMPPEPSIWLVVSARPRSRWFALSLLRVYRRARPADHRHMGLAVQDPVARSDRSRTRFPPRLFPGLKRVVAHFVALYPGMGARRTRSSGLSVAIRRLSKEVVGSQSQQHHKKWSRPLSPPCLP